MADVTLHLGDCLETRTMSDERDQGEKCMVCGRRYLLVWYAPDKLWIDIVGHEGGLLCPDCFDRICKDRGVFLRWAPSTDDGK